jgi:tetratricopeptide (TPR) repeat protein
MVAALFAIHPLRVESVAWIAERKDVLGGLFFFLTLLAYESYIRHGQPLGRYLLAMLFFILGLMSKPMLVTLPLVALLLDYWPLGRLHVNATRQRGDDADADTNPTRQRGTDNIDDQPSSLALRLRVLGPLVMEKVPWLVLSAASCAITFIAQGRAISTLDRLPLSVRLPNALMACVAYIGQMFWPVDLAIFYPHPWKSPPAWAVGGAAALLAAVSLAAVVLRKRHPYLIVGWLWYLGMLVPVIGLVQVGRQAMADRYTYLPQIGLYIAIVWLSSRVGRAPRVPPASFQVDGGTRCARPTLLALSSTAILAALVVAAWHQASYWRDNLTLWTRAVSCTPENAIALNNLASALFNNERTEEARADVDRAIDVEPKFALAWYNRGRLLARDGKLLEVSGKPSEAITKRKAAIAAIEHAVALEPDSPVTQNELALLLVEDHRPREAIGYLDHVLQLDRDALVVMENLAWVLATTDPKDGGDGSRAVALAEHICRTLPSPGADEFDILAAAYAASGRYSEAVTAADRAARLAEATGRNELGGKIRERMKLYEAKKAYRE